MKQTDWTRLGRSVLLAGAASAVAGFMLCCLFGALVSWEILSGEAAKLLALVAETGVLFLVCFLTARSASKSRLPVSVAVAAVFWLLCLMGKALAFSGHTLSAGWPMLLPWAAAVGAGLMASRRKARRR